MPSCRAGYIGMASACSRSSSAATVVHTRRSPGPACPRNRVAARRSSTDSRTDNTTNNPATTNTNPSTGQNTSTTPYAIEVTRTEIPFLASAMPTTPTGATLHPAVTPPGG
jgi:hypothetical protein